MTKWLAPFLENRSEKCTDNTDRFSSKTNMSVFSVHPEGALDKNPENVTKKRTDSTDKFNSTANMSVLSVQPERGLGNNLENESKKRTDNTDRFNFQTEMLGPSLQDNFDERLSIAEYDGHQTPLQAERMAYLDTFLTLLFELTASEPHREWLLQTVQSARSILETYHLPNHP